MSYPKSIRNLIDSYKKLPGIGEKTAERLALFSLKMTNEELSFFSESLVNLKETVKECKHCGSYTDNKNEICDICSDKNRTKDVICVVEEPRNVILFEKLGKFRGLYHVLNGLISPLDGINPEDINIKTLFDRIEELKVKEVIIAVKPSIEGETTSLYLLKKLKDKDVIVSKIAHGIPLGAEMDYIDSLTLEAAIMDRKKISE